MSGAAAPALDRRLVLADTIPGARVRDAILVLSGALLVAALAQVVVPLPNTPVPVTGQTLGVGLVGACLGMNRGALALALYAMLGLALLIAIHGIVNTLALSVVERRREIGMLRAVGMVRGQVRRSIYLESVLIAIYGALLGVILGVLIGWALVRTLARWGLGEPVLPWTLILITLVASGVVGVLAALWPAIRAARTRPLDAIAEA